MNKFQLSGGYFDSPSVLFRSIPGCRRESRANSTKKFLQRGAGTIPLAVWTIKIQEDSKGM